MADSLATAQPVPRHRDHLGLTLATGMASMLDSAAIVAVGLGLPLWRESFSLDVWAVGALGASLTVAIALGALVGGRVADLVGRVPVFTATVLLYAVGGVTVCAATSPAVLFVGIVVVGLGSGADLPVSLAVLTERVAPAVQARLVAATHVLWTVGVLVTTAAGLALSGAGTGGTRAIFAVLAALALVTALVRGSYAATRPAVPRPAHPTARPAAQRPLDGRTLRELLGDRAFLAPLALTGLHYSLYTVVSNTFGSFKTYFLVVVGDASQTTATAISFCTGLIGLAGTIAFVVLAGSRWRRRLFPVAIGGYLVTLAVLAIDRGESLVVVTVALALQNLSFPFVGDALYKVWTQEMFPVGVRATAQGTTIFAARLCAGVFALVTPALLAWNPTFLFSTLFVLVTVVGVLGTTLGRSGPATSGTAA